MNSKLVTVMTVLDQLNHTYCNGRGNLIDDGNECDCFPCYEGPDCSYVVPAKCMGQVLDHDQQSPHRLSAETRTPERCSCNYDQSGNCCERSVCRGLGSQLQLPGKNCQCGGNGLRKGQFCEQIECLNGGMVNTTTEDENICVCPDENKYSGEYCHEIVCGTWGTASADKSECKCEAYHSGHHCEIVECQNGGVRVPELVSQEGHYCKCGLLYSGKYCEIAFISKIYYVLFVLILLGCCFLEIKAVQYCYQKWCKSKPNADQQYSASTNTTLALDRPGNLMTETLLPLNQLPILPPPTPPEPDIDDQPSVASSSSSINDVISMSYDDNRTRHINACGPPQIPPEGHQPIRNRWLEHDVESTNQSRASVTTRGFDWLNPLRESNYLHASGEVSVTLPPITPPPLYNEVVEEEEEDPPAYYTVATLDTTILHCKSAGVKYFIQAPS